MDSSMMRTRLPGHDGMPAQREASRIQRRSALKCAMQVKIAAAAAIAGATLIAAPANANETAAGSTCGEPEATGTSRIGAPIRCMAKVNGNGHSDLVWMVDTDAEGTIGALEDQGYRCISTGSAPPNAKSAS